MVSQAFDIDAGKEYVIRGNSALVKCQFPSFMADHLRVESWLVDDADVVAYSPDHYGTHCVTSIPRNALNNRCVIHTLRHAQNDR